MKGLLVVVVFCCFAAPTVADEQRKVRKFGEFKRSDEITVLFSEHTNGAFQMKTNVVDVLPNGNLKIYGIISSETPLLTKTYELSGLIRPSDISEDDTIQSDQITNLKIIKRDIKKKKKNKRSKSRNHTTRQKVRGQQKQTLAGNIFKAIKWLLVL